MSSLDQILISLKQRKKRITKIRRSIIDFILKQKTPITVLTIQKNLFNAQVHKTTVYRELEFLKMQKFIQEVEFGDGKKRYEIVKEHHHHLICTSCKTVEEIKFKKDLLSEEKRIEALTNFKDINHNLEFFGVCKKCQF